MAARLQFDRLAMCATRPALIDFVPSSIDDQLTAVVRFMMWAASLPNVRLGVKASAMAAIVRSCYGDRRPIAAVDQILEKCGVSSRLPYERLNDRDNFSQSLHGYWRGLRKCAGPEDVLWIAVDDVVAWLQASAISFRDYGAYAGIRPTTWALDNFMLMADRHDCTVFGQFDLPAFYERVVELCEARSAANSAPLRMVRDVWKAPPQPLSYSLFWSLRPLFFGKSKGNLVHAPMLTLWTSRPSGSEWPPDGAAGPTNTGAIPAADAAKRLHDDLWGKIETLFVAAELACGLRPSEPTVAGRKCTPAVIFYADSVTRPTRSQDYLGTYAEDLKALAHTCLVTEDIGGRDVAWASLNAGLNVLRTEAVSDVAYAPLYLVLPYGDISRNEADVALNKIASKLAFLEFTIAHESWLLWRKVEQYESSWKRWSSAIEPLRKSADAALTFLHRLSRHDLARVADASARLSSGFFSMRAALERLRGDSATVAQTLNHDGDSTEDYIRTQLKTNPVGDRFSLRDGLLDAYPYHYLRQPVTDLGQKLDSPIAEVDSFRLLLDDADRRRQENSDAFGRWLAGFLAFAAVVIALPQLVPSIAFDESKQSGTFLKAWELTLPNHWLNFALPFDQIVAAGRAIVIVSFVTFAAIAGLWLGRFVNSQFGRPPRATELLAKLRGLVQDAIATGGVETQVPSSLLDRQDSQACAALSSLLDSLQTRKANSLGTRIGRPFKWLLGTRDAVAAEWVGAAPLVLARTQLYSFEWSNPPPLPRLACVLRYSFQDEASYLSALALTEPDFRLALERAGFPSDQIDQLKRWLEVPANQKAFVSDGPIVLATRLARRGVWSTPQFRTPQFWKGRLA